MKRAIYVLVFILSILILDSSINAWSEYKIGNEVEYNNVKFYVIKDSSTLDDSVTMLKKEPLTYEEIQSYSSGTGAQISNQNGYGGIQYHSENNNYSTSYVKIVVDAWAESKIETYEEARLLTHDDLVNNLGYINSVDTTKTTPSSDGDTPSWVYNSSYWYWTMSHWMDSPSSLWVVSNNGTLYDNGYRQGVRNVECVVRPVLELKKSELGDIDNSEDTNQDTVPDDKDINNIIPSNNEDTKNELKTSVKVDNTYMKTSIIIILLGFISAVISVLIYYKFSNKKK